MDKHCGLSFLFEGKRTVMPKIISLKQNRDFRRLYHRPAAVSPVLVTYVGKNKTGKNRVGITTSKKIGKAHDRNRARRVIREAYRALSSGLPETGGLDFVFVARVRTTVCPMQEVLRAMKKHLAPYLEQTP
jgi:ribonuclease P protein component